MSSSDVNVGQVIVVVEAPASDGTVQTDVKSMEIAPRRPNPASVEKRKSVAWEILHKLHSAADFQKWLKKKEAAGLKYTIRRRAVTWRGDKEYYGCTGPGCKVQLEVLFESSSDDVIISHNGVKHKHGEKPPSSRGIPEKTKKDVEQLFQSGVTSLHKMDGRLRELGHSGHTLMQLNNYLVRLRRQARGGEMCQAYTGLSVFSGDRPSLRKESLLEDSSPPPAEDADFDSSPPASPPVTPAVGSSTPGLGASPHQRTRTPMDASTVRRLVDASLAARQHAYSPYSQFAVGAALLCPDGEVVTGCNVENASFGLTNCAERTAVFKAVSEGRRQFTAVAIAAEMGDKFVGPCGACRQVLAEFNAEMPVILARPSGQITRTNMKALLPMAFLPTEVPFKKE